jgi:phospholipid/cholesterol/gamma-HCH transport system substrate-binding protein
MALAGVGRREDGRRTVLVRRGALALIVAALAAVGFVLLASGGGGYRVTATFGDAGQLVKGNQVKVGGVAVGSVEDIDVTPDGRAQVSLEISDDEYTPLRQGTQAIVKQASLSGIANRYVDLMLGPADGAEIADGGEIGPDRTESAVELDQVFNLLDADARQSLRDVIGGSATALKGRGRELRAGVHYLNPALSTGSRLFEELSRDDARLRRFLIDSSQLVGALSERRTDLTGVVGNLNTTFGALAGQKGALAESVDRLPPFMRRANTTFVNLRAALDDLDPLVAAAKPAAQRLGPFLEQARGFAGDAAPTVRDLSRTIGRGGDDNDLVELLASSPPLARSALDSREVDGAAQPGAFPQTADALTKAAPTIAVGRPYTPEFVGWMDDFSTTGAYDALGGFSRAWINVTELLPAPIGGPAPKQQQFRRCPGANEEQAADGSNAISAELAEQLDCDPGQRSVGP